MKSHPIFIETTDKQFLEILYYSHGKFWIASDITIIYHIDEGGFYQTSGGKLSKLPLQPRDAEAHRYWLKQHKKREVKV